MSAHSGARPEHAAWQGRIFSRSGTHLRYPDFRSATGYGKVDGLCGVNCRHTFGPYMEGSTPVWSEEKLKELDTPKYEYGGRKLTQYEAEQQQRYHEWQIRRWKREEVAMNAAGLDSSEAAAKLKYWQDAQADFIEQTGFARQYEREQINIAIQTKSGIIQSITEREEVAALRTVGKIDVRKYSCVVSDIKTDEVIITDERIYHIIERHPNDYERFCSYIPQIIDDPDYIIEANICAAIENATK